MAATEQILPELSCFKAYDIRGQLGTELTEHVAWSIGRAFALELKPRIVALGGDIRHSSEALKLALALGLLQEGVDVIDLGMTGTEEVYFAAQHLDIDGAIEVTASHNPIDFNGMKLVRRGARPISGDSGLQAIKQQTANVMVEPFPEASFLALQQLAADNKLDNVQKEGRFVFANGRYQQQSILAPYIQHLLSYIKPDSLKPLRLVVNAGNGSAGHVIDALEQQFNRHSIPLSFIKIQHQADGDFPNGIPNPLLPENRGVTAQAVLQHQADFGIAWDGDFDRCFLFDHLGNFIEGYYIVGLLAAAFLNQYGPQKIIHDPRLYWNTEAIVKANGGIAICSKTGHAFIKERMRQEDAIYGGEMSAHHYFRDFGYCDSGMIPWLLVAQLVCESGRALAELVAQMITDYPSSGELNFHLAEPLKAMQYITNYYSNEAIETNKLDGISMQMINWRFNLRVSNTENVLRLNVETKHDNVLMQQKTSEIIALLANFK
ncbi:phosphomannomutase CpsG [Arsukibacterium sp.]|uniref:phosphomannomutase CpsG n=1 Tax=Arsukibacterium sp. TaxID=1977258 RepID=UPI002FD98533